MYQSDVSEGWGVFNDIQIVTTTDKKQRLDKVRAYEEEHRVKIL